MNAFWAMRSPRERAIVLWGAGLAAALLLLALVWLPLERSCARLAAEIPRLSASIATMQRQASEVARVRSMPAIAASAAAPTVTIAEALGKALPGAQTAAIDAKRVRLTGTDVAYGALLEALASGQAAYGLHVDTARIEALPAAGRVRVELVLARP